MDDNMIKYMMDFREPIIQSAIQTLDFPPGSRGLDVGCGVGIHTQSLAKAIAPAGHVTGLDNSPDQISYAREYAKNSEVSQQVSFREGDMRNIPFERNTFDWVWSMDCVGYAPLDPQPIIQELVRVVKPGGRIALLAWSSQQLLPGYPELEARLAATSAGLAPFAKEKHPAYHFSRALGWFRDAGLLNCSAHTFVTEAYAPLLDHQRNALVALFEMRWPGVQSELSAEDWDQYKRICFPGSSDFILDHPDYYSFFTYTMFQGRVVEIN
jgi:demethylmenaquinone methyltransferase/2-methoxy-6-polyprenyl-1,4-benzoquinol methylase